LTFFLSSLLPFLLSLSRNGHVGRKYLHVSREFHRVGGGSSSSISQERKIHKVGVNYYSSSTYQQPPPPTTDEDYKKALSHYIRLPSFIIIIIVLNYARREAQRESFKAAAIFVH
jgi:hypothetical protein